MRYFTTQVRDIIVKFLDTKVIYSIPRQPIDSKICLKSIKVFETSGGIEIHFEKFKSLASPGGVSHSKRDCVCVTPSQLADSKLF